MPIRTAPDQSRYDPSVQRAPQPASPPSVKNVFDRDPVLIPQLFEDPLPPWYRRSAVIILIALGALCALGVIAAVAHFGMAGTAQRLGRVGSAVMRTFANVVGR